MGIAYQRSDAVQISFLSIEIIINAFIKLAYGDRIYCFDLNILLGVSCASLLFKPFAACNKENLDFTSAANDRFPAHFREAPSEKD